MRESDNIVTFPSSSERERVKRAAPKPNYTERRKNRKSMRQFLFRSYNLIIGRASCRERVYACV